MPGAGPEPAPGVGTPGIVERWRQYGFWIREGRLCAEDGRFGAAATAYDQALKLAPSSAQEAAVRVLLEWARSQLTP